MSQYITVGHIAEVVKCEGDPFTVVYEAPVSTEPNLLSEMMNYFKKIQSK